MIEPALIETIEHDIQEPWRALPSDYCRYIRWLLEERKMSEAVRENMANGLLKENASVNAWRILAKTASNAFDDLIATCGEGGAKGRPMDLFHLDDWKRIRNWQKEIDKARCDADPEYAQREKAVEPCQT